MDPEFLILLILAVIFASIGILILRNKLGVNLRLANFLVAFILFIDELWMFGIPFGPFLPDMSVIHIEGVHHWMIGLILMIVILFYFIVIKIKTLMGRRRNNTKTL